MSAGEDTGGQGRPGLWRRLWQPPKRKWTLGIPLGGILAVILGVLLLGGANWAMHKSNSLAFCAESCHEMQAFIVPEYKESAHYNNQSGVRAICSDCHVPKEWGAKVARKIQASFNELPAHFMGKIDTREKFEAHRAEMAERVWATMKANNSKTCRNCHSYEAMDLEAQGRRTAKKHSEEWQERFDDTCIDCHKGVAHELPEQT